MRALYLIVYGTRDEAEGAGAAVRAVHERVRGRTRMPLGVFPAGTPYSASDPELMLWVHGTLVEVSLALYGRLVRRLSDDEEERYYREMSLVARIFGTPAEVIPRRFADFRDYFAGQLAASEITVTELARDVAAVILEAPLPAPLRLLPPGSPPLERGAPAAKASRGVRARLEPAAGRKVTPLGGTWPDMATLRLDTVSRPNALRA